MTWPIRLLRQVENLRTREEQLWQIGAFLSAKESGFKCQFLNGSDPQITPMDADFFDRRLGNREKHILSQRGCQFNENDF
jgi:hypothetical protein